MHVHEQQSVLFTRREASVLADVPLKVVDKAIEERVVKARRSKRMGTLLDTDDVMALALIGRAGMPLRSDVKKKIRRWVSDVKPYREEKGELALSDVVVIRLDPRFRDRVEQMMRYQQDKAMFIATDPGIKQGEPVIAGTRLSVRAVAERVKDGDMIDDLVDDHPGIPREAFETALIYAKAHPRRGRPARPWRDV